MRQLLFFLTVIVPLTASGVVIQTGTGEADPSRPRKPVTWTATSSTAIAITGDITVHGDKLVFGNGTVLPLTFVAEKESLWSPFKASTGKIFRLDPPADPVLLNGNTLCGMPKPVTYIVLSEYSPGSLSLTAFTGSSPPARFGDHSCAAYFYERAAVQKRSEGRGGWRTSVRTDPGWVGVEAVATDGDTILNGACNTLLEPGFGGSLYNYGGDALKRIDDTSEPVIFEIADGPGKRTSFDGRMHYFAPDRAWVITDSLPVDFLDSLAAGDTLTIRNGKGEAAVEFSLAGSSEAVATMRTVCGLAAR